MNAIKPIYISSFLLFIIIILSIKIDTTQSTLNKFYYSIANTKRDGVYIKELKQEFSNKQEIVKKVKQILQKEHLTALPNTLEVTKSNITIQLHNINGKRTNKVINKFLNTSLIISSLKIQNVDFNQTIDIKIKL
jgi:hypothetical protein